MPVLERLDAAAVRQWCTAAHTALQAHREEIDELNVYPVPDGDTGTNLVLTMDSVQQCLHAAALTLPETLQALARGALLGARGNSGVILSQLLRGMTETFGESQFVDATAMRTGLRRAVDLAYLAVAQPVEGTILTVARAAADAAERVRGDDVCAVVRAAALAAAEALERTPDQLEALRLAGVVDAGGRGLCVVLDSLVSVVSGEAPRLLPGPVVPRDRSALVAAREAGSDEFQYEVQFLLEAQDDAVERLRGALAPLGDSLVVVGGDGLWNIHVHVNDVGRAIEAGIEAGRPFRLTVTRFADQFAAPAASNRGPVERAVVAVAAGPGLRALFEDAGAVSVSGGPSTNPSTGELLDAIRAAGAPEVVLLPNDGNVHGAAAAAAAEATSAGIEVHVVPTRSPVQGLAAVAVHDSQRSFTDDVIAMTEAAGTTRWAEITYAVRDSLTMAGTCRAGDVLGLVEGEVVTIGAEVAAVALEVVDRMLVTGGELVTIVAGDAAGAGVVEHVADVVRTTHPTVDVEVHDGGQPHYPILVGVE